MSHHTAVLLLGSNLGDTKENLEKAVELLSKVGIIKQRTAYQYSEAVEFASKNNFCNIALAIKIDLSPIALLKAVKQIERDMGRDEDTLITKVYTDRIIDIDIVSIGDLLYESKVLRIPHRKHLYEREFSKALLQSLIH